jgi:hypothetical protein
VEKFTTRDIYLDIYNLQVFASRPENSLLMQTVQQPISFAFFEYRLDMCLPRAAP